MRPDCKKMFHAVFMIACGLGLFGCSDKKQVQESQFADKALVSNSEAQDLSTLDTPDALADDSAQIDSPPPLAPESPPELSYPIGAGSGRRSGGGDWGDCGGTAPTCSGDCLAGKTCGITNGYCTCLPSPLACGASVFPTCGGTCPSGQFCEADLSGCRCIQPKWTTTPATIDSQNASSAAPLVVDAQGNVTSAWLENYDVLGDDPQSAFFSNSSHLWMQPQPIIQAGAGLATPQLAADPSGTVTLVWLEYFSENANSSTLFASRSKTGGPWTSPVPLNSLPNGIPTNAQVPVSMVVDAQGNVTAAWLEQDLMTSTYAIGTARFTSDTNAPPTLYPFLNTVAPNANNNVIPQLVVDQLGYVTAVWQEQTGSGFAVRAARLDPLGSTWSAAITLDGLSPNANGAITPRLVIDASGIVTAVWQEKSGAQFSVQAARFVPGAGGAGGSWTTYTTLAPALSNAYGSIAPQIVVDNNGSVTIVALDASLSVWPSSFAASSWTSPSLPLNSGTAFSLTPLSMVVDDSGTVTILWLNNSSGLFVQAARGFSTSWGMATNLNAGNADGNTPLLVVIDLFGNVTASWMEGSTIQAARFLSGGSSWTAAATLDGGNLYNQIPPKMVVGPSGAVTVVWQEGPEAGAYAIQAARFTIGENAWTPPTTLDNGSQSPNAFSSSMTQQINMVVDAFDNVTVTWLESIGSFIAVQSARFSGTSL